MNVQTLKTNLLQKPALNAHPQGAFLLEIITGQTGISSAGFPYISDKSFRTFTENIPHLFMDGQRILDWFDALQREVEEQGDLSKETQTSVERAAKVIQTVVFTAGVTAPPDLWVLRQVLSTHKRLGILNHLLKGHAILPELYAKQRGLSCRQLETDLHLLHARGYLHKGDGDFWAPKAFEVSAVLNEVAPLPPEFHTNLVPRLADWLAQKDTTRETEYFLTRWLAVDVEHRPTGSWVASLCQLELGYRLLPLVLALRVLELTPLLKQGEPLDGLVPRLLPEMTLVFSRAGFVREGRITRLGARVFERGPGPFGIIGAYHPYLNHLEALLEQDEKIGAWVQRGQNVAASQDANRKTFQAANDALDAFCQRYGFTYTVFVEHAVGQGEAIRQRFERDGEARIRYFGADLEPKAIEAAVSQQKQGLLPNNLAFVCPADIGQPQRVIDHLRAQGLEGEPKVMMVGNGFHEIRNQTNEKMIEVFKAYQEAGFMLVFTEESALHDEALIHTAWNTYHAGFRYVHALSGQGLRPARGTGQLSDKWSWSRCATLGGYVVLEEYSYRTRSIYPFKRPHHKNPSISETFFCVPCELALELGVEMA